MRVITAAVGGMLLLAGGCAGLGKQLEAPRIALAAIRVQEVANLETVFVIQLRVFNTNDVTLDIQGIEVELEINGQSFATGVSNQPVEIPSYDTRLIALTVYSSVIKMFKSISSLQESEQLHYRIRGKLRLAGQSAWLGVLPFESEGQVELGPAAGNGKNTP